MVAGHIINFGRTDPRQGGSNVPVHHRYDPSGAVVSFASVVWHMVQTIMLAALGLFLAITFVQGGFIVAPPLLAIIIVAMLLPSRRHGHASWRGSPMWPLATGGGGSGGFSRIYARASVPGNIGQYLTRGAMPAAAGLTGFGSTRFKPS